MTAAASIEEERDQGAIPLWRHAGWRDRFPWLVQGTTGAGDDDVAFDLGLFGEQPVGKVIGRWRELRAATGMSTSLHARQVHGAEVRRHADGVGSGMVVMEGFDGHVTAQRGVLLAVSIADCIPVSLVDEEGRGIALLHAGWRGVAGGIVERALRLMRDELSIDPAALWLHCGPAICGDCYEVGPEVHAAVAPEEAAPTGPAPIDLRAALVRRAARQGVGEERCTVSAHCTRCGPADFFSHRGGSAGRQMGVLGLSG